MSDPSYLKHPSGHRLAYHHVSGKGPLVMFLGGFMSDMTGSKALTLEDHCKNLGLPYLRFDYSGHGASTGDFNAGTIGSWFGDALWIFDQLVKGPIILVGSSMGGWIACLMARARPEFVKGLVGIAAAPDFTERMWTRDLSDQQRQAVLRDGFVEIYSDYGPDPYVFTKALFDDGREQSVFASPLKVSAPVRLIQGTEDLDVPWETVLTLSEHLKASGSSNVEACLVPGGDHRLSSELDLKRLKRIVKEIAYF